ncbi:MAG: anthranilate phosphoribosyltransferase [Candidatus Riflebacteria bacterium]|nr:anthranilate phosphoribosyltransferase [Candidatus Riflebacteria bacterium]
MTRCVEAIMDGSATPAQIGAFLAALRTKGETSTEIAAAARVLRARASTIRPSFAVVDTCGTGGDGSFTFNISTTAAFVLAGGDVKVAKHGNRAVSSRSGSADVLEALGVKIDLPPPAVLVCIEEIGVGFLFAPVFHQAMKHAAGPRREIGFRSLFDLLGPLANPAGASRQVLGVHDRSITRTIASVLAELGSEEAMVVAGADGMDELSVCQETFVSHLKGGEVTDLVVTPEGAGLSRASAGELTGGDPAENARIVRAVLGGGDRGARFDAVLLNAAAGFVVSGRAATLTRGVALARE